MRRSLASGPEQRVLRRPWSGKADAEASYLVGVSPAMQELRTIINQVAQTNLNCLIRGESGTGKDLVAREIHRLSARRDRPFVKVNCTALPEQLLESELFGYEKGAFTGALTSKPGRFELANTGAIFLDEIGEMYPNLQAKLLQVIEHKEFTKLGGKKHINVDVQIIAATNADLEAKTKEGGFRHDLYFRLNEVCIWVPRLSSRPEDIPLLVRHFIEKHGGLGLDANMGISGEELARLTSHPWPGNVRELESTVKRWMALGDGTLVPASRTADTEPKPEHANASDPAPAPKPSKTSTIPRRSEPDRILEALEKHQWNRRKASEVLGISYQTLRRRIEKYGLNRRR
ncbi:MAG: sigma-54 dependent transcriptional regulator [Candidatus Hydrogenedentota bacterium]